MTKKTRFYLFLFLLLLFAFLAPIIIIYSFGWRFDFETKKFYEVGSFFFKVSPRNVEILIGDKIVKKTDFIFGSLLLEGLLPEEYNIQIKKEGYHDWQKNLDIEKREVTEVKNIVLIPKDPGFIFLNKNIKNIFFSLNGKTAVIKETIIDDDKKEYWSLKTLDMRTGTEKNLISQKEILTSGDLVDLKISQDSKLFSIKTESKGKTTYYFLDIDRKTTPLPSIDGSILDEGDFQFIPQDNSKIFFLKNNKITEIGITKNYSSQLLEGVVGFFVSDERVYYLDEDGFIYSSPFSLKNPSKINNYPFPIKKGSTYKIIEQKSRIFLQEDNSLYVLDDNEMGFRQIALYFENFALSEDKKRVAYSDGKGISVVFLEDIQEQPERKQYEKIIISSFKESIQEIFWHTNYYVIAKAEGKIKIAETDNRDKINILDYAIFPSIQKIFWDENNKNLYVLSDNIMYSSKKLNF